MRAQSGTRDPAISCHGRPGLEELRPESRIAGTSFFALRPSYRHRQARNNFIVTDVQAQRDGKWQVAQRHSANALPAPDARPLVSFSSGIIALGSPPPRPRLLLRS